MCSCIWNDNKVKLEGKRITTENRKKKKKHENLISLFIITQWSEQGYKKHSPLLIYWVLCIWNTVTEQVTIPIYVKEGL